MPNFNVPKMPVVKKKEEIAEKESLENKIERLRPIFQKSFEVMMNPEMDLEEGIITVTRERKDGTFESIQDLMVMEMTEDGPNLAMIDDNGEPSVSATMLWSEITDVKFSGRILKSE